MTKHIQINKLWSTIYEPDDDIKQVVIGVHGFCGDKESSVLVALAEQLNKTGGVLVTFDLPYHGENTNTSPIDLNTCINSIGIILSYVKKLYKNMPISFFSTSFGAYLTIVYLSNHDEKLSKIILRAPAIFMGETLKHILLDENKISLETLKSNPVVFGYEKTLTITYKFLNDLMNLNLADLPTTKNYLYILQGKLDTTVFPTKNSDFFNEKYPNQHQIFYFENADHRFKNPGELEIIVKISTEILNK